MKIAVTGGSGFIGTNLVEKFIKEGYQVINIDKENPKIPEHNSFWKKIDILDKTGLEKILSDFQPDYIVHLAARTDLNGKMLQDYDSNHIGTECVLEIARKLPELKKIIFTSSMLVCHTGYIPNNDFDYCPTTLYGESKVLGEKKVWEKPPACDWAIIRPTSIWGPWFDVPYRNFFDMVLAGRYFHIGHKGCTKTYGYVGNAVDEIEKLLFHSTLEKDNKIFYIGDYDPTNIEQWADEIAQQLGKKVLRVPFWSIWCAAKLGDFLKLAGITFPMTSFRLKNMTTDNIVDMTRTRKIASANPYTRPMGIAQTLEWMRIRNEHFSV